MIEWLALQTDPIVFALLILTPVVIVVAFLIVAISKRRAKKKLHDETLRRLKMDWQAYLQSKTIMRG